MNKNKLVLEMCPNFYRIINFEYFEEDLVTDKLIKIYENFIFNADIKNDEDNLFRRKMQKEIYNVRIAKTYKNKLLAIVENIIAIFNHYEEDTTRSIYIARWI